MRLQQTLQQKTYLLKKVYEHYRYIRPFTAKNRAGNNPIQRTNIAIFSEPRGGSTWTAELFSKLPESILVSEPMYILPAYRELRDVQFCFNQYIPETTEWPEAEEYFRKLYNQEVGSLSALRIYYGNKDLSRLDDSRYFIYKDVNSNMLLPWITRRFNINPIYLLRHPCAVIASQLKYRHWDYILNDVKAYFPDPNARHTEIYDIYKDIIDKITKPEERLAAEWAIHNVVPLKHPENNQRWITVSYEKLYKEPESELNRIFSRLNIEMPAEILSAVKKPSGTTIPGSVAIIKEGSQLTSWKKSFSEDQVRNIISIVKEFGIDVYDESPEPDYSKVYVHNL